MHRHESGDHPHRVGFLADREASLLDLRTGERRSPKAEDRLTALWLDRDGTVLEVADRALVWRDWDGNPLRAPAPLGVDTTSAGHVSTLFAGRELLVLGFLEGRVEVRRRADGSLHSASQLVPGMVGQVRLSEGGRWVAAVDEPGAVWVWPVDDPGSRLRIAENTRGIGFLGDDELVVLGARLRRWALPDPAQAGRLSGAGGVSNLDWRGELLGAALGSGYARLWRLTDRAFDDVLLSDRIAAKDVAVAADGVRYAAGTLEAPLTVGTFGGAHEQVSWSAGGCRRVVRLVDDLIVCSPQRDGPAVMRLGGVEYPGLQRSGAELVDVEPDAGRTRAVMATGAGDVLLLEAGEPPTLRTLFELPEVSAVAISADGARVAVVLPRSVELRRADGAVIWSLRTDSRLRDIAFSPDDQLLAGGERSGLVRLWRVGDGAELAVLDGHDERAQAVVFSPDGTRLASGSWDETVRLWDLTALERSPASVVAVVLSLWCVWLVLDMGVAAEDVQLGGGLRSGVRTLVLGAGKPAASLREVPPCSERSA